MRFDDTLDTVLAAGLDTPTAAQAGWRQLVDLVARGRIAADARAMTALMELKDQVPLTVRAASARATAGARPPAALVRLLALDEIAVSAPVLRFATLPPESWIALLPELSPQGRAVLRHRRDLDPKVVRALESFGPTDFVLPSAGTPSESAFRFETQTKGPDGDGPILDIPGDAPGSESRSGIDAPETVAPPASDPFRSVGEVAQDLPVVAKARQQEHDEPGETFRIADVVARIEAYQRDHETIVPAAEHVALADRFVFETDETGAIRWVEGVARGPLVGLSLAVPALPRAAGVDGVAAGAFRRRTRFVDAHLHVGGETDASGEWRISGTPSFDGRTGRFTGYRGEARRPRTDQRPGRAPRPDAMRQLVHELRTPTNAIVGFSEMIEHAMLGPVPEPYRHHAETIRSDAQDLLAAIDDLDTAARIQSGALDLRPETVALEPLLIQIIADLAPLAQVRAARIVIDGKPGEAFGDIYALRRLLERLLATLLGVTEPGESVVVRAEEPGLLSISRPRALAVFEGDALFSIDDEDNPASLLGSGFALRLVRNLARQLGGGLVVEGDALTLRLPAAGRQTMEQVRQS
ncbi:HAMP domain-containing histidine kinase [Sphingomonas cannabina]|uniref:sensor histidine kinase n=1 Tax=Sphingomonas cannabina TaxID=2899123 RepID=UPI001F487A2B|nr:HAMP domain-containing sensor histidine kinase [Sphingomonas cannabina]UIJ43690.1 HAMP domain-containing histidine kinase [Sphingomonas cannabina]